MPVLSENLNLGDLLKYEAPNLYSRDRITLAAGQTQRMGTLLGQITESGQYKQVDPSASDGSQYVAGVLLEDCDATLALRDDALMLARHAIVAQHALVFPQNLTTAEHLQLITQLKHLGILVRQGA